MANRLDRLRRGATACVGALVLGAAGCAFPNGSTGGDPLLGSFNRPIVPTPPPERGGLGLDSPAYDAGARIGVAPPEYPVAAETSGGLLTLPTLTTPNLLSGARLPTGQSSRHAPRDEPGAGPGGTFAIPGGPGPVTRSVTATEPVYRIPSPTAFTLPEPPPPVRRVSHAALRDPASVKTLEEAQALLEVLGAKGQRAEQREDGEWTCSCTVGPRAFEAQAAEPLEAMRLLLAQVGDDR